jgi:hypothetical protein
MKTLCSTAFFCFFLTVFSARAQVTDSSPLDPLGVGPITVSAAAGLPLGVATNGVVPPTITWLPDQAAAPIDPLPPGESVAEAAGVTILQETTNGQTVVRFVHRGNPPAPAGANGPALGAAQNGNSPQPLETLSGCLPPALGLTSWWPGEGNANDFIGGP